MKNTASLKNWISETSPDKRKLFGTKTNELTIEVDDFTFLTRKITAAFA